MAVRVNAEALALLARALGVCAAAAIVVSGAAVWLRERSARRVAWTAGAGLAFGCATWVHASVPRAPGDVLIAVGAAWLVPMLALSVDHSGRIVSALALAIGLGGSAAAVFYQPFWDVTCVGACGPADAVVAADPRIARLGGLVLAVVSVCLAGVIARRAPLALAAAIAGIGWAVRPWLSLPASAGDLLVVGLAIAGVVAAVAVWPRSVRVARARAGLRQLAAPSATPNGRDSVNALLRDALGDPTVRLRFPGEDRPADGTTAVAVMPLMRDSGPFAVLESAGALDPIRAAAALTPAVLLGIDDEALRHAIAARIAELNDSRRTLLEASDRERRRLERDAHDGAQQYLIAALAQLAIADPTESDTAHEIRRVLGRLRALSRGISSPILDSASLAEELVALAERTETRLVVSGHLGLAGRTAHGVYGVLAAAASVADRLGLPELVAQIDAGDDRVMLRLESGQFFAGPLTDRVLALGGTARPVDEGVWVVIFGCE